MDFIRHIFGCRATWLRLTLALVVSCGLMLWMPRPAVAQAAVDPAITWCQIWTSPISHNEGTCAYYSGPQLGYPPGSEFYNGEECVLLSGVPVVCQAFAPTSMVASPKNDGSGCPCDSGNGSSGGNSGASTPTFGIMAGDPINTSTGNAYRQDDDYIGGKWLTLRRFYN